MTIGTSSTRKIASVCAATASATSALFFAGVLQATPAGAAPTSADAAFITANEQGNLAEISLAPLGKARGRQDDTKSLSDMTLTDHQKAKVKLTKVAEALKATLPTTPNPMQLAVASQLKAVPSASFDLTFAQAQATAHTQAIAVAKVEQRTTKVAALKSYTSFYIGIATMHLEMAEAEVKALGGQPSAVPAGTGGQAATNRNSDDSLATGQLVALGGGGLVILAGAFVLVSRRRRTDSI